MLILDTLLIGVEGTKTPAGAARQGETPQGRSDRGGSPEPAESEVPGTEINN